MRFRDRLLLVGILLVLVPTGIVTAIYSYIMATSLTADAGMLVKTKLDLLENRIASSHGVLERAGIADNPFYSGIALSTIAADFASAMSPGESYLLLDGEARVIAGPAGAKGRILDPRDPLRAAIARAAPHSGRNGGVSGDLTRIIRSPSFSAEGGASIVAWRFYEPWGLTLVVSSTEARAFAPLESAMRLSLAFAFVLLGLAGAILFVISQRLSAPLIRLAAMAQAIGNGEHGLSIPELGNDEIGILARRFNEMARKMDALTTGLEARVDERTIELSAANRRLHEVNDDLAATLDRVEKMQRQLVESEKLVALGQLVAGIAHELNTPLGAMSMGSQSLSDILVGLPSHLDRLASLETGDRAALLRTIFDEKGRPKKTSSRTERLALSARLRESLARRSVPNPEEAAELLVEAGWDDSPLPDRIGGGELGSLALALYELSSLARSTSVISAASGQAVRVIEALRTYARQDGQLSLVPIDVIANVEQVLTLFSSKIKLGVEVMRNWNDVPPVLASAEKLAQVWTNLVSNALHAMDYSGMLFVSSSVSEGMVVIAVADSGAGIPENLRAHIFTPFFTTKPPGEGTGLGLEISRRIVEDLGGRIEFDSVPGRTEFRVFLPALAVSH